jgi:4-hydroxy-2-oxoheptanedioate aldolase
MIPRMRIRVLATAAAVAMAVGAGWAPIGAAGPHMNPMVDLLASHQPVFGLYAPANGRRGGAAPRPVEDLAKDALAAPSDFIFDGSMERSVDAGLPNFTTFITALADNGLVAKSGAPRFTHAVVVKMQEIGSDYAKATDAIGKQLDAGVNTIMFVGTESAPEVEAGIKAMRYAAKGGTRPDSVGIAPKIWGLGEADYRKKADLWPLDPDGELVNWTIVESKEGLAHVREIAAVKGIGVLWPGAGTLRGVFSSPKLGADGQPEIGANGRPVMVPDTAAWENAIQQVLSACKEFNVACGYPANTAEEMKTRYDQGFRVFVAGWGDAGKAMVEAGRALRK